MEWLALLARARHPTWSAARWYDAYLEARRAMAATDPVTPAASAAFDRAYDRSVAATWALIGFGAKALPFALKLIASGDPADREGATSMLEAAARDPAAVDALVALTGDPDVKTRDAAVDALGRVRAPEAIPAVANLLLDETTDSETADLATTALGRILGRRFRSVEEARVAAREHLTDANA